jgi:hypothetical protein
MKGPGLPSGGPGPDTESSAAIGQGGSVRPGRPAGGLIARQRGLPTPSAGAVAAFPGRPRHFERASISGRLSPPRAGNRSGPTEGGGRDPCPRGAGRASIGPLHPPLRLARLDRARPTDKTGSARPGRVVGDRADVGSRRAIQRRQPRRPAQSADRPALAPSPVGGAVFRLSHRGEGIDDDDTIEGAGDRQRLPAADCSANHRRGVSGRLAAG